MSSISVVLPVYNEGSDLFPWISRLRSQTFDDWKLYAVGEACVSESAPAMLAVVEELPGKVFWENLAYRDSFIGEPIGVFSRQAGLLQVDTPLVVFSKLDEQWDARHLATLHDGGEALSPQYANLGGIRLMGERRWGGGMYRTDRFPSPGLYRAYTETEADLTRNGYPVLQFDPPTQNTMNPRTVLPSQRFLERRT